MPSIWSHHALFHHECSLRRLKCPTPFCKFTSRIRHYTRPSNAPKPILDIKHIAKNPGLYEQNCIDRNYKSVARNAWDILKLTQNRAELWKEGRDQREANNAAQKRISELQQRIREGVSDHKQSKRALSEQLQITKDLKDGIASLAEREKRIEDEILELALALPNLSSVHTPNGDLAEVIKTHQGRQVHHEESHVDIGTKLNLLDFAGSAKSSGWGWYYLKDEAALLEQALIQYTLSLLRQKGWVIISPPSIVYSHIAAACGFQPRDQNDEQQIYVLQQATKDQGKPSLSLAATAEIPLAGMHSNHVFNANDLPLRTCAVSRCYRAEAGARGVDTKGLYRVHEFTKVEMFAWTMPPLSGEEYFDISDTSHSENIFKEMVDIQEEILQALGLTYRLLEMPATDLGSPATRKRDIEVFFPSRKDKDEGWGEVTSTSTCTDYQSRRLGTKVKDASGKQTFPYTLNGTALAVPRILAAILETYYDPQLGSVDIPEVLQPFMYDIKKVTP